MAEPLTTTDESAWMQALRRHCDAQGQLSVARKIGYSATTISLVLAGKYPGNTERIALAVEGTLLRQSCDCPVLGPIPSDSCMEAQRRPKSLCNGNDIFRTLHRACRAGCPHSLIKHKGEAQ